MTGSESQDGEPTPEIATASDTPTAQRGSWKSYAQLMRLPAVFTALADIFLGFMLTHAEIGDAPAPLILLLVTSACLYLAGMVFNDLFDRQVDAVERPQRPIPSGRVAVRSAAMLGGGLVATGLGGAAALRWVDPILCGWNPLFVAVLIVAALFLYDGLLKSTSIGPVTMGLCRFLNVILGASASGFLFGKPFYHPQRWIAAGLAVYIAGVTWFARSEATESRRGPLLWGLAVINAGLAILLGWVWQGQPGPAKTLPLLLLAAIALSINKSLLAAISRPDPQRVQNTIRTLLLSVITLDAALIYAKSGDIALATTIAVALLVPPFIVGRAIRIT
ncbi:MAG: UbiA family prenyltransferase [Planctomycetaceae bacterium]